MTAPVLYAGDPRLLNKAGLLDRVAELLDAETRYIDRIHALEARLAAYERAPRTPDWRRHARTAMLAPGVRRAVREALEWAKRQ